MKNYKVNAVQPTPSQLHTLVQEKLSEVGKKSTAYYAVCNLFESAEALYRTLNFYTGESLALFTTADRYLTGQQEHDLMALTAAYVVALNTQWIKRIVEQDSALTETDRAVLAEALAFYKTTTEATHAALGSPQWLE